MENQELLELWDVWEDTINYYKDKIPETVYQYIKGEINILENSIIRNCYIHYNQKFVDALDGNHGETAKRMLYVISTIRKYGILYSWDIEKELPIVIRIGYTFEQIIPLCDLSYPAYIYIYAEQLLKYFHDEIENYVDDNIQNFDSLMKTKKSNNLIYLIADFAALLLQQDKEKYTRYIPFLKEYVLRQGHKIQAVIMLYKTYSYAQELTDAYKILLTTNYECILETYRLLPKETTMINFLDSLSLPHYPYYMLVATDVTVSYSDIFGAMQKLKKIYVEDREQFIQAYHYLLKSNTIDNGIKALRLLSILLYNNDSCAQKELEDSEQYIISFARNLNREVSNKLDIVNDILENKELTEQEKIKKLVLDNNAFKYAYDRTFFDIYIALYEYDEFAKKLIDLCINSTIHHNDFKNKSTLIINFITTRNNYFDIPIEQSISVLEKIEITRKDFFIGYCNNAADNYHPYHLNREFGSDLVKGYETQSIEIFKMNILDINETVVWLDTLYNYSHIKDFSPVIELLEHKSKKVLKKCEEILFKNEPNVRHLLEQANSKLKINGKQIVRRIINRWDNERKFGKDFSFTNNEMIIEFCQSNFNADMEKTISWISDDIINNIHFKDGSIAPDIVFKYVLVEYCSFEEPCRIQPCDKVIDYLNTSDIESAFENIYQLWLHNKADAKNKMIMVPYCVYASDSQLIKLKKQLEDWADSSRGAIAAFVTTSIALNAGDVALLMVDGLSVKSPGNQIKKAAKAAFAYAAQALEVPLDELADRIVPTLGFSSSGEKIIDYGNRQFTISLLSDFSLSIFDTEKNKVIKSLPAAGANDDKEKAESAKKEFASIKKQIKAVVQNQTIRLQKALMSGRPWTLERWKKLFIENPIMHIFSTTLIWGTYDKTGNLLSTFRYMDDGTFNTVDEDEYILPQDNDITITLAHPIEMGEDLVDKWKQQLDDYEIVQAISQLESSISVLDDEQINNKEITRYKNKTTTSGKLTAIAKKYDMQRGYIGDGGGFYSYHFVDYYLNIGAEIMFDDMYVGIEFNESVSLDTVHFYSIPEQEEGAPSIFDNDINESIMLNPHSVPKRFMSSILSILDSICQTQEK